MKNYLSEEDHPILAVILGVLTIAMIVAIPIYAWARNERVDRETAAKQYIETQREKLDKCKESYSDTARDMFVVKDSDFSDFYNVYDGRNVIASYHCLSTILGAIVAMKDYKKVKPALIGMIDELDSLKAAIQKNKLTQEERRQVGENKDLRFDKIDRALNAISIFNNNFRYHIRQLDEILIISQLKE